MGLISSVQTLLHYSSLHQVCSYSHPGFQEFPPLHTVRNIHQRAELSLPHSRKLLTAAPNRASVPRSLQGMEGSLPSFHPALALHSFFFFLPLPARFLPEKAKASQHTPLVRMDRRGPGQGTEVTAHLMHFCIFQKPPEPGSS